VLVTAADSPFAVGRVPTLKEIAAQPLIGYRHCRATETLVDQIRAAGGAEPHFVFRSDENGVVQGLARSGIGVAVLPRLALDPNDDAIRVTTLSPRLPRRQIGIARHKDRYHSSAARAFLATALEVGAETTPAVAA
jgi:LysR family transcriptional regulator, cys regulon transcriptional activator